MTYKPYSDLDILYSFPVNSAKAFARFDSIVRKSKEALENSSLAIKADLVDLDALAMGYRDSVLRDCIAL